MMNSDDMLNEKLSKEELKRLKQNNFFLVNGTNSVLHTLFFLISLIIVSEGSGCFRFLM